MADFLQKQELDSPVTFPCEPAPGYNPEKMKHFENIANAVLNYDSDDDSEYSSGIYSTTPTHKGPLLISGLAPPAQIGPIKPPTPTDSLRASPLGHLSGYEAAVSPTELVDLKEENLLLRCQLLNLEKKSKILQQADHSVESRLGLLKYHNEANKGQKASMGRALAEKDMEIKNQQLDNDDLIRKLAESEAKLRELKEISGKIRYGYVIAST